MRRLLRRLISRLHAERARLARRLLGPAGEELRCYVFDLREGDAAGPLTFPLDGVTIGYADPDQLIRDPEAYGTTATAAAELVRGGDRCLVVRAGALVLYRAAVTSDSDAVRAAVGGLPVPPPSLLVSNVVTHPAHRGLRLHAAAMAWLAAEARAAGAASLVAWVARWNRSSRRAFERAGFRPVRGPSHPRLQR